MGLNRRTLIGVLGTACVVGLSACAPNPVVTGDNRTAKARRVQTLPSYQRDAAVLELGLAAAFSNIGERAAGWGAGIWTTQWCQAAAAAHNAHATILVQADPLAGTNGDRTPLASPPAATPAAVSGLAQGWTAVEGDLRVGIDHYRQLLTDRTGPEALLFISLQCCAQALLNAVESEQSGDGLGPAPEPGSAVPARVEIGPRAEALAVTLTHVDALVYALQAAIGRLPRRDPLAVTLEARLPRAHEQRDQLASLIASTGEKPGAPQLEYQLPPFATSEQMGSAIGHLERDVMDAWAAVAASSTIERDGALQAMNAQASEVRARGVALSHWPGWV